MEPTTLWPLLLAAASLSCMAQKPAGDQGDDVRSIYKMTRPAPGPAQPAAPSAAKKNLIGVTLWVLRDAKPGEEQRALRQRTPVRAPLDGMLRVGQQVRLSVESLRPGYLYIVDQEKYENGTLSEPVLIFPTARTRGGDNKVGPGILVEVPDQRDDTPWLTVEAAKPNITGELLTVILAPNKLNETSIGPNPVPVSRAQFAAWVNKGTKAAQIVPDVRSVGTASTAAEKEAGVAESRRLTYSDPIPQTLFNFGEGAGSSNLVLEIPLLVKR